MLALVGAFAINLAATTAATASPWDGIFQYGMPAEAMEGSGRTPPDHSTGGGDGSDAGGGGGGGGGNGDNDPGSDPPPPPSDDNMDP